MPYNLRSRNRIRDIRIPRRGDRVTIFWNTLRTAFSGTLTRYDPIHKTFLVVYDRTPEGFDDHRIWEALDLVPWRFHAVRRRSDSRSEQDDVDGEDGGWFQPGELGTTHPQFRTHDSPLDSESELESDDDRDELDWSHDDIGNDDPPRGSDEDESFGMHDDDAERVERAYVTEIDRQTQNDDEDREAGEEHLSADPVEKSVDQRETEAVARHQREERHCEQPQFAFIQESKSGYESEGVFEVNLKDCLSHPPLATKHQTSKGTPSQPAVHLHSQATLQVQRGQNLQIRNSIRSDESENGSPNSLYDPPFAPMQQTQRRFETQQAELFDPQAEQQVRCEHKRSVDDSGDSGNESDNSLRDSLYHPPLAQDQRAKRRKHSQPAQQHVERDGAAYYEDDAKGNASQHDHVGQQRQFSPHRASQSRTENELMDSFRYRPLAPQQQKPSQESSQLGFHWQARPIRASKLERGSSSREIPHNQLLLSSKQVPTRKSRGIVQKLQMKRMRRTQHGLQGPQIVSAGIFNDFLYEPNLAPQQKAIIRTSSNPEVYYTLLTGREHQDGERQLMGSEKRAQQDPEQIMTGNPHHVPPALDQHETIQESAGNSANPHIVEKPESEVERESELTSTHVFKESGYRPTFPSARESTREMATNPVRTRTPQEEDFQANREPQRRRRYANFGPSGFSWFNGVGNEEHQQSNSPVQVYAGDTVHINFSRETQQQSESHHTNQDNVRVSTGHHVLHSDMFSVEDQIKSITKTLGVPDDEKFNDGRKR